jgi:hypothetical protein
MTVTSRKMRQRHGRAEASVCQANDCDEAGEAGRSQFSDDSETLPKHRHGVKDYFPIFVECLVVTGFAKAVIITW